MNSIDKSWVDTHIDSNGEVVIPEGVEKVEEQAFANNEKVKRIIMPDSVVEIGGQAFLGCTNLQEIKCSCNLKRIPNSAFKNCSSLSKIDFPENLEEIGIGTFRNCVQLKTASLGSKLKVIGPLSFAGSGIEQIDLPSNLEQIDVMAFFNCSQLQQVHGGVNVSNIEYGAFQGTSLTSFEIPNQIKSISGNVFGQNPSLSSITLNENLDFLSEKAFYLSDNLQEVSIDGTKRINYGAFINKSSIRKIKSDGQEFVLSDNEKLFSLQKSGSKMVIVVQDEKGKFSSQRINLEKGTSDVVKTNAYLTDDGRTCFAINSLANVSITTLENLKKSGQNQIYIYGGDNEIKPIEHEKGFNFNLYSIDDLIQIKSRIQELKKQIKLPPEQDKHRQKKIYAQIVRVLSENIEYDYWGAGINKDKYERLTGKSYDEYIKENSGRDKNITDLEDRNLVGLIRGMAVCQGNAEIIRNLTSEFGIQSICVRGKNNDGADHMWKQVKLDGRWYDDDFTYYQTTLARGNFEKCGAFLMGQENGMSITEYNKYKAYTKVNTVGKNLTQGDREFLLNYGRVQQQAQQQSVQPHEKERPHEESIKDEVGDEFKPKSQEQQNNEQEAETKWMNSFQACDRQVEKMRDGAKKKQEVVKLIQDLEQKRRQEKNEETQEENQNNEQR